MDTFNHELITTINSFVFDTPFMFAVGNIRNISKYGKAKYASKSSNMETAKYNISKDFGDIIVGIIFLFIIACEFFITYSIKFNKRKKEEVKD